MSFKHYHRNLRKSERRVKIKLQALSLVAIAIVWTLIILTFVALLSAHHHNLGL